MPNGCCEARGERTCIEVSRLRLGHEGEPGDHDGEQDRERRRREDEQRAPHGWRCVTYGDVALLARPNRVT